MLTESPTPMQEGEERQVRRREEESREEKDVTYSCWLARLRSPGVRKGEEGSVWENAGG